MTAPASTPAGPDDRDYQVRGVQRVGAGLARGGRGQLRAACGTGKTKMAMWSAHELVRRGDVVVIACPTVALVGQTLREWSAGSAPIRALSVCCDDTVQGDVVQGESVEDDTVATTADLGGSVGGSVT